MKELNKAMEQSTLYDSIKIKRIDSLRSRLQRRDPHTLYNSYLQLYNAYKVFNFDSAFVYAQLMENLSEQLQDPVRIVEAKVKMGYILLSSGMFTETAAFINTINANGSPDSTKIEYYLMKSRLYFDLADYNQDKYYTPEYIRTASRYIDSALHLMSPNSFEYRYNRGLQQFKLGNVKEALSIYPNLDQPGLTDRQIAVSACTLGAIYVATEKIDTAIALMIRSAISDIRASTKETMASYSLATLLFEKGDIKNASHCIERAIAEAVFYGARQRKVMVSSILPIIERERILTAEERTKSLLIYAAIVTLLLVALVVLAITVFRQVRKLKVAQRIITEAHLKQQEINNQLLEANKIKEEYVGYCFNINATYIAKLEKLKQTLEQKLTDSKSTAEVKFIINNINIRQERDELFMNFDRVFLKIFPHFVTAFNDLFDKDNQVILKENELLNTDLRIFALIRIGINDNEKIASILEYSVNTIYAYKTKIKKRSLMPSEEFEQRIMDIKAL
ncbi:tetratricopeptide repeat protein [Chitinophaga silvatica]|uniref:Tetratricopeptide repeat protein n=2 Tax=Chitinophaga silvatica TaxID=2282649 RepID=A0A3E1YBX2_9BACT|nr:tetratricopeptide repeat protein [Chitinophaga silvatica]